MVDRVKAWLHSSLVVVTAHRLICSIGWCVAACGRLAEDAAICRAAQKPIVVGPVLAGSIVVASILDAVVGTPLTWADWLVRSYLVLAGAAMAGCSRSWIQIFEDSALFGPYIARYKLK